MRIDQLLVKLGLAKSRTRAQELILEGRISLFKAGVKISLTKASHEVAEEDESGVALDESDAIEFVSRGGLKLEGALDYLKLVVKDKQILDVGISTGGFTDCLLRRGAERIVGVDVGHGQLATQLIGHPRLCHLEGINVRELSQNSRYVALRPANKFDFVVIDVSFIGLDLVIPVVESEINDVGYLLALVKPQFELGKSALNKKGVVKDAKLYIELEKKIKEICTHSRLAVLKYFESNIQGREGNREFFVFAKKIKRTD